MDSDLQGNKACLVIQLLESPAVSDGEACVQWIVSEPDSRVSSNDRKRIETLSKEIELLVKTKAVAPQLKENLDAEIMRKEAEITKLELYLLGGVVFNTTELMRNFEKKADEWKVEVDKKDAELEAVQRKQKDLQLKVKEKELEIAALQRKQKEDNKKTGSLVEEYFNVLKNKEEQILDLRIKRDEAKVMTESLEKQLTEKCKANEALEMSVSVEIGAVQLKAKGLQLTVKEKEAEIADIQRKQQEDKVKMESLAKQCVNELKNKEAQILDLQRKRDEAKEAQILVLQRKREEAKVMIESLEKLKMSVRRLDCQLKEKDLETARELGEKDQLVELARKKHEADKLKSEEAHILECNTLILKVERAESLFASYLRVFLNRFRKDFQTALDETISETVPQHGGDVIQTEVNLEKQKVK